MKTETKLFLSFLFLYVIFAQSLTWGEYSKMDLFMSIADENRFQIDTYANNTGDRSYYDGHYYSDKAPGLSFLSEPFYLVAKESLTILGVTGPAPNQISYITNKVIPNNNSITRVYDPINPGPLFLGSLFLAIITTSALPAVTTILLVYKTSGFFLKKPGQQALIAVAYGAGTIAFSYGTVFFTHSMAAMLSFASFYVLFSEKQSKKQPTVSKIMLAGLFAGLSVVMDYPAALILVGLFIYTLTFKKIKLSTVFAAASVLGIMPLLLYNITISGSPLKFVYSFTDPSIRTDVGSNMGFNQMPNLFIMFRHTFDPYRGLFFYSPILMLAVVGLYWMFKEHRAEAALTLAIFVGMLVIFSMRGVDFFDFGTSLGARNYIPVLPFLMMPLSFGLKKVNFRIFNVLLIASICVTVITLQDWEWMIGSTTVYIAEPYRSMVDSFQLMPNPLKDHYFPLFLENGPRARIIENIFSGKDLLEIRHAHAPINDWPFVTMLPVLAGLAIIWRKDLSFGRIVNAMKHNPEIIFVPMIMLVFLI